ncbi:coiled-coil domain-containing protein 122 [Stigmatopora argus]
MKKMSNSNSCEETQIQTPENISQRVVPKAETLQKDQEVLKSLQVTLSNVQKNSDEAEKKLRRKVGHLIIMEDDLLHHEQQIEAGRDHCASLIVEKTKLLDQITEEEEKARKLRSQFDIYRRKMESHRQAILHAVGEIDVCEKRELVQKMRKAKEDLKEDLNNPHGIKVQTATREIDALTGEIRVRMENIAEMREIKRKELESHTRIKKDIEVQKQHFDDIRKQLHSQISRAQAIHGQMSRDIHLMERKKAQLLQQLNSSTVSAHELFLQETSRGQHCQINYPLV